MKKTIALVLFFLISSIFSISCGSFDFMRNFIKSRITVQEAVDLKKDIDSSDNPAYKFEKIEELKKTRIRIEDIVVRDVVTSNNVDYYFCIIVSAPSNKGDIECYVYTGAFDIFPEEDIETIARLRKGKTRIDIDGDFNRFFTLLDETFTKIEIINANINIKGD